MTGFELSFQLVIQSRMSFSRAWIDRCAPRRSLLSVSSVLSFLVQQGVSLPVDTIQYRWIPADSRSLASNKRQHAGARPGRSPSPRRVRSEAAMRAVTTPLRAAGTVAVIGPRMLNGAPHSSLAPCRHPRLGRAPPRADRGFIEVSQPAHRTAEFPAGGDAVHIHLSGNVASATLTRW